MGFPALGKATEGHTARAPRLLRKGNHRGDPALLCTVHTGPERENASNRLLEAGRQGMAAGPGNGNPLPRVPPRVNGRGKTRKSC